jgi:hypothetical protein
MVQGRFVGSLLPTAAEACFRPLDAVLPVGRYRAEVCFRAVIDRLGDLGRSTGLRLGERVERNGDGPPTLHREIPDNRPPVGGQVRDVPLIASTDDAEPFQRRQVGTNERVDLRE